jgi:hypothetical protein
MSEQSQNLIRNEMDKLTEFLLAKNRKYGDSALNPRRCFSKASPVEQIKVRIDDKLSRLENMRDDEDEDVVLDMIGYLVLYRVAMRMKNDNKAQAQELPKA